MERVNVYLGLGSNQGNRELNLLKAMNLMDEAFGTHPERISRIIETPAWGFDGQPFLNMCVLYRLPRKGTPEEHATGILRQVKEVEKALGRNLDEPLFDAGGNRIYHDRIIDIDILCYGAFTIHTENLIIPHPLIAERDFARKPLLEISKPEIREAFPELFQ
ncbi:MAG: 2-amino-4-hydroxy-6-hydroxymethyldihydropteridine diphosphokinase [Bacteroidales bacterium]|nr:2-amino-4-hydroxy-6-hydroxymethyldihydropteridine diphosphokinase [Bacteroidales bacterium]